MNLIKDNIDFVLSHFEGQHELFPRSILTGKQRIWKVIDFYSDEQKSKDRIIESFRESGFIDCRINAFPHITQHRIDVDVKNKTAATFIMIDLDLKNFDNKIKLDNQLTKTLNKLSVTFRHERFHGKAHPTVLWTGNGYHIYQPIAGMVLEEEKVFFDFLPYLEGRDMTTEFLRFAEKYFTNGKADPQHSPSIMSCLVRVPGTFNSKNNEEVKIIQSWNGGRPPIQLITGEFRTHLIQKRIDKIKEKQKEEKLRAKFDRSQFKSSKSTSNWIEKLLGTPLHDYRKYCLWRILCPYLLNIKKLSRDEAIIILSDWLRKCDEVRKLDFNAQREIIVRLKNVKSYLPSSKETLRKEQPELYNLLAKHNVFQSSIIYL
jgi:hypothetical protein